MKTKLILSGLAALALGVVAFLTRPGKKTPEAPAKKDAEPVKPPSREISEAERKRIAQEWGRKGAKKSAEVRRAKKAAREKAKEEEVDNGK